MRRLVTCVVFAAIILGTAAPAQAVAPTPTPPPTRTPPPTPTHPPTAPARDPNTDEICQRARAMVQESGEAFVNELNAAGTLAGNIDLRGAQEAIKQAGNALIDLSGRLRGVATIAQRPELKQALEDVAAELNTLGQRLASLTGVKDFDTTQLEALIERLSQVCGG